MVEALRVNLSMTAEQRDRAAGVLVGMACGDALGAGYEFGPPRIGGEEVAMVGGGAFGWEPGEWTDDTSMAIVIAEVASTGADLRAVAALDAITARFVAWMDEAPDVGAQTSQVLSAVRAGPTAASAVAVAEDLFRRTGKTGNGSLMRTAPVALAYLDDEAGLVAAAHAVSALTHGDGEAGEACALWCLAIRHAVLHGNFGGLDAAVSSLPPDRAALWSARLRRAESVEPHEIEHNGWVVAALTAAWSAITRTPAPADDPSGSSSPSRHLRLALDRAVRAGGDTDTVAAIAGGLLGARWGASAVPRPWRRLLHGWPGLRGRDLIRLALLTVHGGHSDDAEWAALLDPDSW
jgi:ADP-ribosyl-[dinitrogen reductase] hydrolase